MIVSQISLEEMTKVYHYPVMHREVIELLDIASRKVIVDCTVGVGSHACKFLPVMDELALLVGIDRDQDSLKVASQRLSPFGQRCLLYKDNFSHLDHILDDVGIERPDVFFFDLGISAYQLSDAERGFSFLKEGPLDMRMDRESFFCAYDLINNLSEMELGNIFKKFGEERFYRRIASGIVEARRKQPISTTTELTRLIAKSIPGKSSYSRIHPATRVFQSLRIAVNRELEALEQGLTRAVSRLGAGGRIGVISFHSLEDRIVKNVFKNNASHNILRIITKKPLAPTEAELEENWPSRSAKLRVADKL
jgi:16S rRNA (cytosine1402-N4)-methyltransferase